MTRLMTRPHCTMMSIVFGILFWITNCLTYYGFVALRIYMSLSFLSHCCPAFVGLVGALPISISGFGVRENLVVYLYSTIYIAYDDRHWRWLTAVDAASYLGCLVASFI